MRNFKDEMKKLYSYLKEKENVKILEAYFGEPLRLDEIIDIETKYNIQLHPILKDFYKQLNGFKINWLFYDATQEENPFYPAEGMINILPLEDTLKGFDGSGWENDLWFDWMSDSQKKERQKLLPFDYFYFDDSNCTCFDLEDPNLGDHLVLHSVDLGVKKLNFDVSKYFDFLLESKGFIRWQYFVIQEKSLPDIKDYYVFFKKTMSALLPNSKLVLFR